VSATPLREGAASIAEIIGISDTLISDRLPSGLRQTSKNDHAAISDQTDAAWNFCLNG
jgi:hypothetical protein